MTLRPPRPCMMKKRNARPRHSAARPKSSGMTTFSPRNDRPYGLEREAFQTENALALIGPWFGGRGDARRGRLVEGLANGVGV